MSNPQLSRRLLVVLTVVGSIIAAYSALADSRSQGSRLHAKTQSALNEIVQQGTPGVIAQVRDSHGVWNGRSGVDDLSVRHQRSTHQKFRIASVTKTFTATVLLKLEAKGRLSLDDSLEKWLPGVVRGANYRPEAITVRHLLNHTSGIFDYNMDEGFRAKYAGDEFDKNRYTR